MTIKRRAKRQAKQLYRFCLVNGVLEWDRARRVAQRIAAARRRDSPAVLAEFLHLLGLDRAAHTARIESAVPLTADLETAIETRLSRQYGPGLTMNFVQRPSLIGGVRIQVGSDVYDGTVRARLGALEKGF
jgi:F-type H+-transporting ATPase subunit delta